jgi:general secretion pathway protein C
MFAIKRLLPDNPEKLGRLSVPVTVIFIVLLAHGLAQLSWRLLLPPDSDPSLTVASAPPGSPQANPAQEPNTDYPAVAEWHLFGEVAKAPPKPPPPAPTRAPETRLNLNLVGIFFSDNSRLAVALIAASDNTGVRGYRVGDPLPGGATLEQVYADRVVLSRNGQLETLSLPRQTAFSTEPPAASPDSSNAEEIETINASDVVAEFRERIATQPQALRDLVQARPFVKNGQFMGFRLLPGLDDQVFEQLGLEPGDVITQINDVRLTDPQQSMNVLREILNADQVSVQVLRKGAEIPYNFVLNSNP